MASATWKVDVEGQAHEVRLEWTYWSGHRDVLVDGVKVDSDTELLRWKSSQQVDVAGKLVTVVTRPRKVNKAVFDVLLQVDGRELEPVSAD